ncbi:MAG: hypothetical protein KW806_02005 [Candidatus Yanofskybacteria bacterium]|nr:hypothetical protein [Candidatus Yanofskybacteria bacterium]
MFRSLNKALYRKEKLLDTHQARHLQVEQIINNTLLEEFGPLAKNIKPVISYKASSNEVIIELGSKVFLSEVRAKLPVLVRALRKDAHEVNLVLRS